jgi:DNA polymerase-3 subunit delta
VADALQPIYLICGSDRPKVLRAVARLRARVLAEGGSEELHEASVSGGQEVALGCEQLGLFTGDRLVLVAGVEAWKADDVAPIAAYAASPTPGTTLALVAGPALRKDHKARGLVTAKTGLLEFEAPTAKELPEFVRREAQRVGARLEPEAVRRLIELVGVNAMALEREIDKLATYAAGELIDREVVEGLAFRSDDVSPFALQDAISSRRRQATVRALVRAEEAGEKPHALLPQVARHVDLLRRARRASGDRIDQTTFAKRAGVHPFRAQKAMEASSAWPEREAAAAVVRFAIADHEMKGGRRIDPQLAFERAVLDVI